MTIICLHIIAGLVLVGIVALVQWLRPFTDADFDQVMRKVEEEEGEEKPRV